MFTELCKLVRTYNNILILPHLAADGDCLGSAYALKLIVQEFGKNVEVLLEPQDRQNRILKILYGTEHTKNFIPELVIAVDCGDRERMGSRMELFNNAYATVCIDHHPTNDHYADVNYVNADAAATAEIIYEFAQFLELDISAELATNIYVGIVADTGGFAYSNTRPHTHSIAGQLLECGVNHAFINSYLFEMNNKKRILLKQCAYNSFETFFDDKIAVVSVTAEQVAALGATEEDAACFVDIPRSLETAVIAISFREVEGGVKVSMRSQLVDVAAMAKKFGGGGHVRAAGCTLRMDLNTAKRAVVDEAERRIKLETRIR